jgi:Predicted transcriptional regulator containing the HTH domain
MVEAVLFLSGKAISTADISKITGIVSVGQISKFLREIENEYRERDTPIIINEIAGKFIMELREPYASRLSGLANQPEISKGALRILAYISKNEPIMQNRIVNTFGDSAYQYIKELVEKEFITTEREGRTRRISTTKKFSEYFGIG